MRVRLRGVDRSGISFRKMHEVFFRDIDTVKNRTIDTFLDVAAEFWVQTVKTAATKAPPAPRDSLIYEKGNKSAKLGWYNFKGDAKSRFEAIFHGAFSMGLKLIAARYFGQMFGMTPGYTISDFTEIRYGLLYKHKSKRKK